MPDSKEEAFKRLLQITRAYGYQPKARRVEFGAVFDDVLSELAKAVKKPFPHEVGALNAGLYETSRIFSSQPKKQAYKTLRGYSPGLRTVTPEDAILPALVWSFGHSLIEAAKDSLPVECKMLALRYQSASPEEREAILERVINQLLFSCWSAKHPVLYRADRELRQTDDSDHVNFSYSPWMVLPHVFGRFPDSPMRPNCMGVSILMSAWCRLAELKYMHCRLIQDNTSYHWAQYAQLLRRVMAFCETHSIELPNQVRWEIENNLEQYERILLDSTPTSSSDGHAFVCAEVNPGEWAVIDPWMARLYDADTAFYDEENVDDERFHLTAANAWEIFQSQVAVLPGLTLTSTDRTWDNYYRALGTSLDARLEMARLMQGLVSEWNEKPLEDCPTSLQQCSRLFAEAFKQADLPLPEGFCDEVHEVMAEKGIVPESTPGTRPSLEAVSHSLEAQLMDFLYSIENGVKRARSEVDTSGCEAWYQRFEHDYGRIESLTRRVWRDWVVSGLIWVLTCARDSLDNATVEPHCTSEPYTTIEYGVAPVQVGLGALTHLIAWDDTVSSQGELLDLLPLTSSQIVWHEAVTAAHKKYADHLLWREATICSQEELDAYKSANPASGPGDFTRKRRSERLPTFGQLMLSDGQEWPSLLESSGAEWLSEERCELLRTSTQAIQRLEPYQQHRLVRRLLTRLEGENHPSAIPF